jgi:hypothetical protein
MSRNNSLFHHGTDFPEQSAGATPARGLRKHLYTDRNGLSTGGRLSVRVGDYRAGKHVAWRTNLGNQEQD